MSVLSVYFDKSVNQASPVKVDLIRKVNYDKEGDEHITFEMVDYPAIQKSHGTVEVWSLDALLKAGVNPNFSIRTGNPTRLEGISVVADASAVADEILKDESLKNE